MLGVGFVPWAEVEKIAIYQFRDQRFLGVWLSESTSRINALGAG